MEPKIKWWKLKDENQQKKLDKITPSFWSCSMNVDIDPLWTKMEHNIKDVAKEVLEESKGSMPSSKDTSW